MVPKPLSLPEDEQPFTENIDESERSVDPIDFTRTFNQMLPGRGNNKGKPLIIDYTMDGLEGKELTITKSMVEDADGVKTIKAELVIVIPLKLRARAGGATIDATNYLGGMIGQNLLNFADRDLAEISLDPLTLNITLSGTPIDGGHLIVERNAATDNLFDDEKNQPIKIDLSHENNIRIPLAENLTGQSFTLQSVRLELEEGGSLQVPRGLSLLSLGVNTGIDTTFDL
jgi:hypothetical protein